MKHTTTHPRVPYYAPEFRYRDPSQTDVAATIAAERRRIGAMTGAQVRADRAARLKAERDAAAGRAQQPLELVVPIATRKVAR